MEDDELEQLRAKRLADLQRQQQGQGAEQAEAERHAREQQEAQKDAILRAILTPEARERLTRVRIARPDQADVLERQLVALAQSGRLQHKLTDDDIKDILSRLFPPKREINIRRKGSLE